MSQEDLGKLVGVSRRVIWTWEAGRSSVPADEMPAIAGALGVGIVDLYADSTPPAMPPRLAAAEKLANALELGPERIEVNVYVRGSGGSAQGQARTFTPTPADRDMRDLVRASDSLTEEQRRRWMDFAEAIRAEEAGGL